MIMCIYVAFYNSRQGDNNDKITNKINWGRNISIE